MGTGSFNNSSFNFVIVAPHPWTIAEKNEWQATFISASRALYEASEGQLSFGKIFMADKGWGLGLAEFVVHDFPSTAYATNGGYGTLGRSVQLFSEQRLGDPRTIVHEFGHHAFGLGDEYTGPVQQDDIDTEASLPDQTIFNVVPLQPSENDSQSLYSGFAILLFEGKVERLIIQDHTATQLTVFGGFTQDPRTADNGRIFYQPQYNFTYPEFPDGIQIRCGEPGTNYCLMGRYSNDEAVTEFCSQNNHDLDHDTSHDEQHGGLSCWQVIQQVIQDRYGVSITAPNPAQGGQQTEGYPLFFDLEKEVRIALVMDRSGSMGHDNKIQGARFGIEQWIAGAHQDTDWLSVIWFNEDPVVTLALDQINASQADGVIGQVNSVNTGGWTNIKDSLLEAADQIQSEDGRAAVQAIVLLTDGIHNRPDGTTIAETIPTLQEAGIPVYVIALGTPDNVDYDALEELAVETGGAINQVGLVEDANGNTLPPDQQNAVIAIRMSIMNNILRYGLVNVGHETVAGAPPDSEFGKAITDARDKRLMPKDIIKLHNLDRFSDFVKKHRHPYACTVPFLVEEGASKARFVITYEQKQKFHLYLIDPEGNPVDFTVLSSGAVLIAPEKSPYATAIVNNPKQGLWHAVIGRASTGTTTRVNYTAGVENRMVVVHADCDREVMVGMSTRISASAVWGDHLSGLSVTARLTGPDGSVHSIVLSDEKSGEPNSGDYCGMFTPELHGRYEGEVRIVSKGRTQNAGSIHRAVHAKQNKDEAAVYDMRSKAPRFIRRIPLYLDAGTRPVPKDLDEPRRGRGTRAPVQKRKKELTPLNIDKALKLISGEKPIGKKNKCS